MNEYKLDDRVYNLRRPTYEAIQDVCRVMCERDDLSEIDKVHYAKIAGFPFEKNADGSEYIEFRVKYTKSDYCDALAGVLFEERPVLKGVDRSVIHDALGFFLASFGETSHDVRYFWSALQVVQMMPELENIVRRYVGGDKDISEE
jgi:hypothetical protein